MLARRLGRYEVEREIAAGGMAKVYLGRVVGEGGFARLVALKVMHEHLAADPDFVSMFLDEARLAARIRHPNVVSTLDVQKTPEAIFLVMDYIDGPSLNDIRRSLTQEHEFLPIDICLGLTLDVLAGLHAAHELRDDLHGPLNLVHRDVSPHNILVGRDGVARLADFGVARAEARISSTSGSKLKGKVAYMSPEQIFGEPVDRRSDLYATGLVLWEILCGRRLFNAENHGELIQKILSKDAPWAHQVNEEVPIEISAICMQAIAREPSERFSSADEFAVALEGAARAAGIMPAKHRAISSYLDDLLPHIEETRVRMPADSTLGTFYSSVANKSAALSRSGAQDSSVDRSATTAPGSMSWSLDEASTNSLQEGPTSMYTPASMVKASHITNAEALLWMAPPRSRRRGLIAAVAASCIVASAAGAVVMLVHSSDAPSAAATPVASPQAADTPSQEAEPSPAPTPPPPREPTPPPAPAPAASTTTAPKPNASKPTPKSAAAVSPAPAPRPRPAPAPKSEPPSSSPTTFRPSRL
jgi:serine/threonine-protein kinase